MPFLNSYLHIKFIYFFPDSYLTILYTESKIPFSSIFFSCILLLYLHNKVRWTYISVYVYTEVHGIKNFLKFWILYFITRIFFSFVCIVCIFSLTFMLDFQIILYWRIFEKKKSSSHTEKKMEFFILINTQVLNKILKLKFLI